MSGEQPPHGPSSLEEIFQDFQQRRLGLIKALTTDFEDVFKQCDPDNAVELSLYGLPDEWWRVSTPCDEVPADLPEPVSGINFVRDSMPKGVWAEAVALRSDAWLMGVAFFIASIKGLGRDHRRDLFYKINELPTILDVVRGTWNRETNGSNNFGNKSDVARGTCSRETDGSNNLGNKSETNAREEQTESRGKNPEEAEEASEDNLCGVCHKGESQTKRFWICCDLCKIWYHGKCVGVTAEQSMHIKSYKCPSCSSPKRTQKKGRANYDFIYY